MLGGPALPVGLSKTADSLCWCAGLTAFGWLSFVLFRLNQVLRQQVALKAQLQPAQCTAAGGVVVAQVLLVLLITWQQRFWRNLVLVGSGEPVTEVRTPASEETDRLQLRNLCVFFHTQTDEGPCCCSSGRFCLTWWLLTRWFATWQSSPRWGQQGAACLHMPSRAV